MSEENTKQLGFTNWYRVESEGDRIFNEYKKPLDIGVRPIETRDRLIKKLYEKKDIQIILVSYDKSTDNDPLNLRSISLDCRILLVTNKTQYVNRLSIAVGTELMKRWSVDYVPFTYKATQKEFCQQLDIEPSNCVIFGIDTLDCIILL